MPSSPESGHSPEQQSNPYQVIWNSIRETPIEQLNSNYLVDVVHQQGKGLSHKLAVEYLDEFAAILGRYRDEDRKEIVQDALEYIKHEK